MAQDKLRWGILGAAAIVRKNWKAIHATDNAIVAALASRDLERARGFIAERQAEAAFKVTPRAFGSYEALLASDEVDAVYVALPTGVRKEWVIRAAEAGKHVLCEKPCAVSAVELKEMLEVCRHNRVQFMDGVMFMHHERLGRIRAVLNDGASTGPLKRITSVFSFRGAEDFGERNVRAQSDLEPSGCLGDLGWYCIRLSLWAMNWQMPKQVFGRILSEITGRGSRASVPTEFSGELDFGNGVSAAFYCSFFAANQQWANLSGTRGYVLVPDFVLPNAGSRLEFEVNYQPVEIVGNSAFSQEASQFRNFTAQVQSGQLNAAWPDMALKTQQVTDACLAAARGTA